LRFTYYYIGTTTRFRTTVQEKQSEGRERLLTYFWLDRTNQVVVFQVVETDDFHEIHFDFNDAPYADLDDAIVTHQNGWNVATFTIPFDDPILNWDVVPGDYRNFYDVTVQVQKGIDIQEVSGNAEWTFEIISKEE